MKKIEEENKVEHYHEILDESLGEDYIQVLKNLYNPVDDVVLSEELHIDNQQLRAILNQLLERRMVKYQRVKINDHKAKTVWQIREDQVEIYSKKYLTQKIHNLSDYIKMNSNQHRYHCDCNLVDYTKTIEDNFVCEKCKKPYHQYHDSEIDEKVMELARLQGIEHRLT